MHSYGRPSSFPLLLALFGAAFGCSSSGDSLTCGAGTVQNGSECVADVDGGIDSSTDDGSVSETSTDAGDDGSVSAKFAGVTSVSPAGTGRLLVTWDPASDATTPASKMRYSVYAAKKSGDQNFAAATVRTAAGVTSVLLTDLDPVDYFIVVRSHNAADKEDANTVEKKGTPAADSSPPNFAGVKAGEAADGARVKLSWDAATDDLTAPAGISYLVYYATDKGKETFAIPFAVSAPGATTIVTPPLPVPKSTYYFMVRARDAAGNISVPPAMEAEVSVTSGADTKPPTFSGCNAAVTKDAGGITVFWDPASDDVTATSGLRYVVYGAKDSAKSIDYTKPLATFTGGTSGVVTGLAASSTYYLVCRARDASENEDDNTTVVSAATSADSIAPTFGGVTSITNVTATSVDLVWTGATDDKTAPSDIVYAIWASPTTPVDTTVKETTTVKGATSTTVSGLTPATKYYFVVRARDSAGNEDTNKIEKSATTNVSFVLSVQPIFTASCAVANCHSGTSPPANMKLEEGLAYSYIVNVNSVENPAFKRVKPGDSANSYLYQKLIGTHMCAPSWPTATAGCATMPLSATGVEPITPAQKDQIKTWIDQGASDK